MFSFPPATWMFRFAGFASALRRMPCLKHGGFPHSGIRGSLAARASPRHFAACRALLRPWEPRASPVRPCSLARRRASLPAALCAFSLSSRSGAFSMPRALVSLVCFLFVVVSKSCVLLSSLSHPVNEPSRTLSCRRPRCVENVGLEPTTPGLQSRCSSQLSQSPAAPMVVPGRLELPTPTLSVWCSNRLSYGTPCLGTAPRGRALMPRLPLKPFRPALGTPSGFQLAIDN